jgi:phosphoglycerate dehydrogenase-like enzyme
MRATERPSAALLMFPGLEALVLSVDARGRLESVVDLVAPVPFATATEVPTDVEVLLTGWGCPMLGDEALTALPELQLIAHAAGTVRPVATDSVWDRGIVVTSAASANAIPVAEFTFAVVVMITKDVFAIRDRHRETRGRTAVVDQNRMGSRSSRIGLVGASTIGRLVIERLRSLDVNVVVADPYLSGTEAAALGVEPVDLDELLATSDVVSLHAPLLESTRHMVGADQLAAMRDGAWLVNTARGGLVDTDALTTELVSGRLHAFLDTTDPEPLPADSPLYDLSNVVLTPHIAGSMGTEVARMGDLAVTEVERFVAGEPPLHPVVRSDLDHIA